MPCAASNWWQRSFMPRARDRVGRIRRVAAHQLELAQHRGAVSGDGRRRRQDLYRAVTGDRPAL